MGLPSGAQLSLTAETSITLSATNPCCILPALPPGVDPWTSSPRPRSGIVPRRCRRRRRSRRRRRRGSTSPATASFFRLVTKGAALEFVTFGFYRFWLVTDIRRHLWSNTAIDGDAAEYTGRAAELLIGFLIALAILVPIYLAYFLISVEVEHLQGFASTPLFAAFYVFGQFAIYRARRYRLTRTVWRGVRFWMDRLGLGLLAARDAVGPVGVRHARPRAAVARGGAGALQDAAFLYGDLRGDFEGDGWEFFKRGWWMWLPSRSRWSFPWRAVRLCRVQGAEWRWWLSGIRIGGVSVELRLPHDAFYGLYWKVIGWYDLLFIAFLTSRLRRAGVTLAASRRELAAPDGIMNTIPLLVVTVIGYLALALAFNVVSASLSAARRLGEGAGDQRGHDIEAAANVAASGELASALGEGFADGLDVAGF